MSKITEPIKAKAFIGELSTIGVQVKATNGQMTDEHWITAANILYEIYDKTLSLIKTSKKDWKTKISVQLAANYSSSEVR